MSERNVLGACLKSRQAYALIQPHLTDEDFTEQGRIILRGVGEYYERDPDATATDPEVVARDIARGLSSPKHKAGFAALVAELASADVSVANVVHDFIGTKREAAGARLAGALAAGRGPVEVRPLLDAYAHWCSLEKLEEDPDGEVLFDAANQRFSDVLREQYDPANLIPLLPEPLNERLNGGLLRGHHVILYARPEAGKSLFLINAIGGFVERGLRVLYVGNEDPLPDIVARTLARLAGCDIPTAISDPEQAEDIARERLDLTGLVMVQLTPGTPREIEELVAKHKPDVLIVDQLRNIAIKQDTFTLTLEAAAKAMRNIGQRHRCLVISATQAGASAEGKDVLDMGDIADSNTGVPAQADVMVGLGYRYEDEAIGRRIINLPKNKRSGKHEFFPVRIQPLMGTIKSIV